MAANFTSLSVCSPAPSFCLFRMDVVLVYCSDSVLDIEASLSVPSGLSEVLWSESTAYPFFTYVFTVLSDSLCIS